jgi:hypothetical protein
VPEDAGSGATWKLIVGDTGGAKQRGNSTLSQPAPPKDVRIEATRRSIAGKAGGEDEGQPENSSKAGQRLKNRGNLELNQPMQRGRIRDSGKLEYRSPAQPKGQDEGQPEDWSPGKVKGRGVRGNPETQSWLSGKMKEKGQPGPLSRG